MKHQNFGPHFDSHFGQKMEIFVKNRNSTQNQNLGKFLVKYLNFDKKIEILVENRVRKICRKFSTLSKVCP